MLTKQEKQAIMKEYAVRTVERTVQRRTGK